MGFRVRQAAPHDYGAFVRLFPELEVEEPVASEAKFVEALMPTTLIAATTEDGVERVVGYAYFEILKELAYVRNVVTAPEARRTGVGRALMRAVAERARDAQCAAWCLNVKPANASAIALYESLGLARAHTSQALRIGWATVEAGDRSHDGRVRARSIEPADDASVEAAMSLPSGQLAAARASGGRVLVGLFEGDGGERVVGATLFDPSFPGAYPFRVARPELALVLLRAIRSSARPEDLLVNVVSEGQGEVADALRAAGATLVLDIVHMKGPLPGSAN